MYSMIKLYNNQHKSYCLIDNTSISTDKNVHKNNKIHMSTKSVKNK